jgi:hypothetical protein
MRLVVAATVCVVNFASCSGVSSRQAGVVVSFPQSPMLSSELLLRHPASIPANSRWIVGIKPSSRSSALKDWDLFKARLRRELCPHPFTNIRILDKLLTPDLTASTGLVILEGEVGSAPPWAEEGGQMLPISEIVDFLEYDPDLRTSLEPASEPSRFGLSMLAATGMDSFRLDTGGIANTGQFWEQSFLNLRGSMSVRDWPLVAVVDTGCSPLTIDVTPSMIRRPAEFEGKAFYDDDSNGFIDDIHGVSTIGSSFQIYDSSVNGHGTNISSKIGGVRDLCSERPVYIGMSPLAGRILTVRSIDDSATMSALVLGIIYAAANDCRVLNLSWTVVCTPRLLALESALRFASDKGCIIVCAAGNDGRDSLEGDTLVYPACLRARIANLITVAAFGPNGLSSRSNIGIADIAAPGMMIVGSSHTSNELWSELDGTSQAAAIVSGCLARQWETLAKHAYLAVEGTPWYLPNSPPVNLAMAAKILELFNGEYCIAVADLKFPKVQMEWHARLRLGCLRVLTMNRENINSWISPRHREPGLRESL